MSRLRRAFRWASGVEPLDLVFVMSSVYALRALLSSALLPLGAFDEGLLFANAQMMADGRFPYRDFYSNYPPGIFQIVRMVMAFSASPIVAMRCIAFFVHLATAVCCAVLVGHARRRAFCFATFSCVAILQADTGLTPFAYTFAVLMFLCVLLCWPRAPEDQLRTIFIGLVCGCLSYLRHDVFLYIFLPLSALEAASWLIWKRSLLLYSARQVMLFVGCTAVTVLVWWIPVFARAGIYHVTHDLYLDMGVVMAARVLPMPDLFAPMAVPALSLELPGFLADSTRFGLVLGFAGVAVAIIASARQLLRNGCPTLRTRLMLVAAAAALATLPQALGRTDYYHVAFGVPLVVVACFPVVPARVAQLISLLAIIPLFTQPRALAGVASMQAIWQAKDAMLIDRDKRALADFIVAQTQPGEPIFSGCRSHRRAMMSVLDIHYIAHRPGATRYMQFDPGLVTSAEKQSEMIADLERTRPRLVLRLLGCSWDEPNASMQEGASLLDEYLQVAYVPDQRMGMFEIWKRSEARK
ncbi:MAG TPA: hypothetical protein VFN67_41230 [Polyangiales bacterium]|nr:hypothetical protein [Polyangiales bacterium]